ncbi:MAG: tryptophan--tRNA ligase [Bacillota bacterium]
MMEKKRLFSGIQPTGILTLGNYIGALANFADFQDEYECIYSMVDLHSITVRQEPALLRKRTVELLALYLACGLDPEKTTIFVQSHVPAHAELGWVLNTITYMGELQRMTQFKDKSRKHEDNINAGLFTYPTLMAADILLYQSALVPVGVDQKQHLELARDIATRFNSRYSDTFVVPDGYIPKTFGKIMSLQEPTSKMSKSDTNPNAMIALLDDKDTIIRKFKKAVTDSDNQIRFAEDKPGISNLLTIYAFANKITIEEAEKSLAGVSYASFKEMVGEAVAGMLMPIQAKQAEYLSDKEFLKKVMKEGADKASWMASKTLRKVYKKIGFVER